jgi:hypothetical protein
MEENERGLYIVDTETEDKRFVKSNVRGAIIKEIETRNLDIAETNRMCLNAVPADGNGEMLILRLNGQLRSGAKSMINREEINRIAVQRGFLIAKTYLTELLNPEARVQIETRKRTLEEIEREFLSKLGYKKDVVDMAIEITGALGKDMTPSEKSLAISHAMSVIKGVLNLK